MTDTNFISQLIANAHLAQLIHQKGTLIYANAAAARVFGFMTITAFAQFAKDTGFLSSKEMPNHAAPDKTLMFKRFNGDQKLVRAQERVIDWNNDVASYVRLELVRDNQSSQVLDLHSSEQGATKSDDDFYILNTIDSAMNWARHDTEGLETVRQPFDAASLLFQLCKDLMPYADERGVSVNVEVAPRAQKIFQGDGPKFARAASCIVRYAIDRVLGGRVDVLLKTDVRSENLFLEVCDNGMPYRPTDINVVFDLPAQPPNEQNSSVVSSELSLPLARALARHLGGEVGLKVNYAEGGLVRMRLPFPQVLQDPHTLRCTGKRFRQLDVLIVEDNATSQHVIKIILETLGHRATVVGNGTECLDILRQAQFDLILMDLNMPIKDGFSTTASIRAREQSGVLLYNKPIPILAITADKRTETKNRALAVGVTGFLTKPVHVPQIMNALGPYIEVNGQTPAMEPRLKLASRGA